MSIQPMDIKRMVLYTTSFATPPSDWPINAFYFIRIVKHTNELKRIYGPISTLKIIEGIFLIKENCIFGIIPVR